MFHRIQGRDSCENTQRQDVSVDSISCCIYRSVIALITYTQLKTTITKMTEDTTFKLADSTSDTIGEWINRIVSEVKTFAERNVVINALKTGE